MSDTNSYQSGNFDHVHIAVNGKIRSGKKSESIGGSYINGNTMTCLALNGNLQKSKGMIPLSEEFIHISSKTNSSIQNSTSNFTNGNENTFKSDYIGGSLSEHITSLGGGKGTGHLKTFNNGHINGYINGLTKNHCNGYMNRSFEVESKNNKNVTFKVDSSQIRNSKGNGINIMVNTKMEESYLKGEYKKDSKGKLGGEAADEISTEL